MAKTQNRNYATNSEWGSSQGHHSQTDSKKKKKIEVGFRFRAQHKRVK